MTPAAWSITRTAARACGLASAAALCSACSVLFGDAFDGYAAACEEPCGSGGVLGAGGEGGGGGAGRSGGAGNGGGERNGDGGGPAGGRSLDAGFDAMPDAVGDPDAMTDAADGSEEASSPEPLDIDPASRLVQLDNYCTGTLLRKDWVLTNRGCAADANQGTTRLVTVRHPGTAAVRQVTGASIFLHPDLPIDVGLLRVDPPIDVGDGTLSLFVGYGGGIPGGVATIYRYGADLLSACGGQTGCEVGDCVGFFGRCMAVPAEPRAAVVPVESWVASGEMWGSALNTRKYLRVSDPVVWDSYDRGGPLFANGALIAISGGPPWRPYAGAFAAWVKGLVSPVSSLAVEQRVGRDDWGTGSALVGDVNGDGRADAARVDPAGRVVVSLGRTDGSLDAPVEWFAGSSTDAQRSRLGDYDGDGRDDLVVFDDGFMGARVALNHRA